jgi:phosphate transport system protein
MATGDHISKQYDQQLEDMRSRVLQMGGLVESQLRAALDAFEHVDVDAAQAVVDADKRVNDQEVELDRMVNHLIARRQPTAGDLRMITGVSKVTTDLERAGDEATKIARAAKWLRDKGGGYRMNRIPDIRGSGNIASNMLRGALDAFARMDVIAAASIIRDDQGVDDRFKAILRQLITFMMEDARTISAAIDTIWVAKAIERIGDHAKNIAETVIFIAEGTDVRHVSVDELPRAPDGQG